MRTFLKKYFVYVIIFFVLIILVLVFFLFKDNFFPNNNKDQNEIRNIVEKVGEHMYLPEGENPTVATVSDPKALSGQAFFENAKKGDKVLIYTNAKKAILYDPVGDKIITIAPLYLGNENPLNNNSTILEDKF